MSHVDDWHEKAIGEDRGQLEGRERSHPQIGRDRMAALLGSLKTAFVATERTRTKLSSQPFIRNSSANLRQGVSTIAVAPLTMRDELMALEYEDLLAYYAARCPVCKGERRIKDENLGWLVCICQEKATVKWRFEQINITPPELKSKSWHDSKALAGRQQQTCILDPASA
jgi:hypothetical protein